MNILLFISEKNNFSIELIQNEHKKSFDYREKKINNLYGYYIYTKIEYNKEYIINLREQLSAYSIDFLYLTNLFSLNKKSLFVFDMDSTLIKEEIIDEIARINNVYEEVSKITEEAMQGKLDFSDSLKKRCALLKGSHISIFETIYKNITINPGVENFIEFCKKNDIFFVVLSGGFSAILEMFKNEYDISDFRANSLEIIDKHLTGNLTGEIIDKVKKKEYLLFFRNKYNIESYQVVAIGDGSNDLMMLQEAAIGIGYNPKDGLKKHLINWVRYVSMDFLCFLYE
jgi:phosphoserine phosphatase